jgi:hypothetical protein
MTGGTISGNSGNSYDGGGVYGSASGGGVFVGSNVDGNSTIFKKSGGVIYGSDGGGDSNLVKDHSGNVVNGSGHAVYANGSPAKRREITAGPGVDLDSTYSGSIPGGGWV